MKSMHQEALGILEKTSRTFFIPISRLPSGLQQAVGSGYLCMRAIDEIEDHPTLDARTKIILLRSVSQNLQTAGNGFVGKGLQKLFSQHPGSLEDVTLRLDEWIRLAPDSIAPRIWDTTAAMSDRMAYWVENNWQIHTKADLDRYTFGVAGAIGLLLSDMWAWYDGTKTDRNNAVGFGRGLQSVNILLNRGEDLARGVDFFPDGWDDNLMFSYSRKNLAYADKYLNELNSEIVRDFCKIPLSLAYASLDSLVRGDGKLDRANVLRIVAQST